MLSEGFFNSNTADEEHDGKEDAKYDYFLCKTADPRDGKTPGIFLVFCPPGKKLVELSREREEEHYHSQRCLRAHTVPHYVDKQE